MNSHRNNLVLKTLSTIPSSRQSTSNLQDSVVAVHIPSERAAGRHTSPITHQMEAVSIMTPTSGTEQPWPTAEWTIISEAYLH